jgi:alkanesulfonate monooxygenase SsuD/methylene tetrahydromethanopterin reductase-like flavin-dependent oxidoreductase (luciferase family)
MKVRIGYGLGTRSLTNDAARFTAFVDALEAHGFDSLWLSERLTGECPDPLIGLAVAAGRTQKLKLGTSVQVLPGRNPVLLAKEWASLDRLSSGRTLPAFGLGVADPREQQAFGVERGDRAKWFDEALPLIRRLWTEDSVDHDGTRFHYENVSVTSGWAASPRPSSGGWAVSVTVGCRRSARRTTSSDRGLSSRRPRQRTAEPWTRSTGAR